MTTRFSVVGSPIYHSLSPVLHSAAYEYLGLDFLYEKNLVGAGELEGFLGSRALAGVSVTMPLKQEAFDFAASHDKYSLATGVANTLIQQGASWSACNTDVYGIKQSLATVAPPINTTLIGSGSTARSAVYALFESFPKTEISVLARSQVGADELVGFAESLGMRASAILPSSYSLLEASLVMSMVPAGSFSGLWSEIAQDSASRDGILFDVAYNPWPSEAALAWEPDLVISGIEMLIWQAIEQVQLFVSSTGADKEIDRFSLYQVMKDAVSSK
jgi:shikimate dehydrogenase